MPDRSAAEPLPADRHRGETPMEEAREFQSLMDAHGWTEERLSSERSICPVALYRSLSLLKLDEAVQARVDDGAISPYLGHLIAKIANPKDQIRLADEVVNRDMSFGEIVARVRSASRKGAA